MSLEQDAQAQEEFVEASLLNDYTWRRETAGYHEFVNGRQFTSEQEAEFKERMMPLLAINRTRAIILHLASILTERRPGFTLEPRSPSNSDVAHILKGLLEARWDACHGQMLSQKVVFDSLVYGRGFYYVWVKPYANFGKSHVVFDRLHPHDVLVDPYSRKPDYSDAARVVRISIMTGEQIKASWPKADLKALKISFWDDVVRSGLVSDEIGVVMRGEQPTDPTRAFYQIAEGYELVKRSFVSLWDENGMPRAEIPAAQFKGRERDLEQLGLMSLSYDADRVRMLVTSGKEVLDEGDLPISRYPIVPLFNAHEDTPLGVSEVPFLKGPQNVRNSATNMLLHYLVKSSNAVWRAKAGSIVDKEQFARNASAPAGLVEYEGEVPPERMPPAPLPEGFMLLPKEMDYQMEYLASAFGIAQGDTSDAPSTYRATLQLEEYGRRRTNLKQRQLEYTLSMVGKVALEYAQAVYTTPEILRIAGPDGVDQDLLANVLQGGTILNDLTTGAYDVKVTAGSTVGTSEEAELAKNLELLSRGVFQVRDVVLQGNFPNKKDLLSRQDELGRAMQMIKQLQQEIRTKDIQLAGMEGELRRGQRQVELKQYRNELAMALREAKQNAEENPL